MLHVLNLEEIESMLLKVPALVTRLEERDPDFVGAVRVWLAQLEKVLSNNHMPATAEVAVCRCELVVVERGESDGGVRGRTVGGRKLREARTSHLLRRATDVTTEAIRVRRGQVEEASRIMMQVAAAADRLGLIPAESGQSHTAYLQTVMESLSNRPELAASVVHVTGLLGKGDALIVLDRSIMRIRQ